MNVERKTEGRPGAGERPPCRDEESESAHLPEWGERCARLARDEPRGELAARPPALHSFPCCHTTLFFGASGLSVLAPLGHPLSRSQCAAHPVLFAQPPCLGGVEGGVSTSCTDDGGFRQRVSVDASPPPPCCSRTARMRREARRDAVLGTMTETERGDAKNGMHDDVPHPMPCLRTRLVQKAWPPREPAGDQGSHRSHSTVQRHVRCSCPCLQEPPCSPRRPVS